MDSAGKQKQLQRLICSGETLVVPDAYDAISARIIEHAGFAAVQCSGYSISVTKGYDDERAVSFTENLERTREIAGAVVLPVMADGEDGYGQGRLFEDNIRRFVSTGIAGINIEDQNLWNDEDREVIVAAEVMLRKIDRVIALKRELDMADFVLNARTDALRSNEDRSVGLETAIQRANLYLEKGADMAFVPYVKTREELRLLKREINGPLSVAAGLPYNIREFSINDCREIGIARVSLPSALVLLSVQAMLSNVQAIAESGTFDSVLNGSAYPDSATIEALLKREKSM